MTNIILLSMLFGLFTQACNLIAGSPLSWRACLATGTAVPLLVGLFLVWRTS